MLEVRMFTGGPFVQNTYLAWKPGTKNAVAIDAGAGVDQLIETLNREGLQLEAILLTHAHLDHIDGAATLKRHAPHAPIYLHEDDQLFYDNAAVQAAQFGVRVEKLPPVDKRYDLQQPLKLAGITFELSHVPGHAPGHISFHVPESELAFVGDVVFQNSIGRTDLPGGDYQTLMRSIRDHVMTLPDDTVLYSGHGPETTVKRERTLNPFIAPLYGGSFA
jgi:glyoxylase-like metal-dependent hydrolase (beta-lactamase superfamily II)